MQILSAETSTISNHRHGWMTVACPRKTRDNPFRLDPSLALLPDSRNTAENGGEWRKMENGKIYDGGE